MARFARPFAAAVLLSGLGVASPVDAQSAAAPADSALVEAPAPAIVMPPLPVVPESTDW